MKNNKTTMTKRMPYEFNELDTMAEYLQLQLADGWELSSKTGVALGFRRCEPRCSKVSVELAPDNDHDAFDNEFIELCEADGWNLFFRDNRLLFFENPDLDAEPIHTDQEVKLDMVHKKCLKSRVIPLIILLPLLIGVAYWEFNIFRSGAFSGSSVPFNLICTPAVMILILMSLADYFIWYRNAKKLVSVGDAPVYKKSGLTKFADISFMIIIFIVLWGDIIVDNIYYGDTVLLIFTIIVIIVTYGYSFVFPKISARSNTTRESNFGAYVGGAVVVGMLVYFVGMGLSDFFS